MALSDRKLPVISITLDGTQSLETHSPIPQYVVTDTEDLDSDKDVEQLNSLLLSAEDECTGCTDTEFIHTSDEEDDLSVRPKTPTPPDYFCESPHNTLNEVIKFSSSKFGSELSKISSSSSYYSVNQPEDGNKILTDVEDISQSEEEKEIQDHENIIDNLEETDCEMITEFMSIRETTEIKDEIKANTEPVPATTLHVSSKSVGRPKRRRKLSQKVSSSTGKSTSLLPSYPAYVFDDCTDVEYLPSGSDEEETDSKQMTVCRWPKTTKKHSYQAVTDIEDMNISDADEISPHEIPDIEIPEPDTNFTQISEKTDPNKHIDIDTDTEEMELSSKIEKDALQSRQVFYYPTSTEKKVSASDSALPVTDTEEMDDLPNILDSEEYFTDTDIATPLKNLESHYGLISQSVFIPKPSKVADRIHKSSDISTDTEDVQTDESVNGDMSEISKDNKRVFPKKLLPKLGTTDVEDYEQSDADSSSENDEKPNDLDFKFVVVDGEPRLVVKSDDNAQRSCQKLDSVVLLKSATAGDVTDIENVDTSVSSEDEESVFPYSHKVADDTTDVEFFTKMHDEFSSDSSLNDGSDGFVTPNHNLQLHVIRSKQGQQITVVRPVTSDREMLSATDQIRATDEEDLSFVSDTEELLGKHEMPEIPEIEREFVKDVELVKKDRKKLRVPVNGNGYAESVTDTEDIFLDVKEVGRRKKLRHRHKLSAISRQDKDILGHTDVEELEVSDSEAFKNRYHLNVLPSTSFFPTGGEKTDTEELDVSDLDDKPVSVGGETTRALSATPEFVQNFDYEIITEKEGDGPFLEHTSQINHQNLQKLHLNPIFRQSSPFPEIVFSAHTDTEEIAASADEDADNTYSRAETATPKEVSRQMDEQVLSTVHVVHSRKFDFESPEEVVHLKGGREIRETLTDVEDVVWSEEESTQHCDDMLVMDERHRVCVCLPKTRSSGAAKCVCIQKNNGELSMVWTGKNTTAFANIQPEQNSSREEEDWTEKSQDQAADVSQGISGTLERGDSKSMRHDLPTPASTKQASPVETKQDVNQAALRSVQLTTAGDKLSDHVVLPFPQLSVSASVVDPPLEVITNKLDITSENITIDDKDTIKKIPTIDLDDIITEEKLSANFPDVLSSTEKDIADEVMLKLGTADVMPSKQFDIKKATEDFVHDQRAYASQVIVGTGRDIKTTADTKGADVCHVLEDSAKDHKEYFYSKEADKAQQFETLKEEGKESVKEKITAGQAVLEKGDDLICKFKALEEGMKKATEDVAGDIRGFKKDSVHVKKPDLSQTVKITEIDAKECVDKQLEDIKFAVSSDAFKLTEKGIREAMDEKDKISRETTEKLKESVDKKDSNLSQVVTDAEENFMKGISTGVTDSSKMFTTAVKDIKEDVDKRATDLDEMGGGAVKYEKGILDKTITPKDSEKGLKAITKASKILLPVEKKAKEGMDKLLRDSKEEVKTVVGTKRTDISHETEDSVKDIKDSLDKKSASLSKTLGTVEKDVTKVVSTKVADVSNIFGETEKDLEATLDKKQTDISHEIEDSVKDIKDSLDKKSASLSKTLDSVEKDVTKVVSTKVADVSNIFGEAEKDLEATLDGKQTDISHGIEDSVKDIKDSLDKKSGVLPQMVGSVEKDVTKAVGTKVADVSNIFGEAKKDLEATLDKKQTNISHGIEDSVKDIKDSLDKKSGLLPQMVGSVEKDVTKSVGTKVANIFGEAEKDLGATLDKKQTDISHGIEDSVKDIKDSLDKKSGVLPQMVGSVEKDVTKAVGTKVADVSNIFGEAKKDLEATLDNKQTDISHGIEDSVKDIKDSLDKKSASLSKTLDSVEKDVTKVVSTKVADVSNIFGEAEKDLEATLDEKQTDISHGIEDSVKDIKDSLDKKSGVLPQMVGSVEKDVTKAVGTKVADISNIFGEAKKDLEAPLDKKQTDISHGIEDSVKDIKDSLDKKSGVLPQMVGSVEKDVTKAVGTKVADVSNIFGEAKKDLEATLDKKQTDISHGIEDSVKDIKDSLDKKSASLSKTLDSVEKDVTKVVSTKVADVSNIFGEAEKDLEATLDEKQTDISHGIEDSVKDIKDSLDKKSGVLPQMVGSVEKDVTKAVGTKVADISNIFGEAKKDLEAPLDKKQTNISHGIEDSVKDIKDSLDKKSGVLPQMVGSVEKDVTKAVGTKVADVSNIFGEAKKDLEATLDKKQTDISHGIEDSVKDIKDSLDKKSAALPKTLGSVEKDVKKSVGTKVTDVTNIYKDAEKDVQEFADKKSIDLANIYVAAEKESKKLVDETESSSSQVLGDIEEDLEVLHKGVKQRDASQIFTSANVDVMSDKKEALSTNVFEVLEKDATEMAKKREIFDSPSFGTVHKTSELDCQDSVTVAKEVKGKISGKEFEGSSLDSFSLSKEFRGAEHSKPEDVTLKKSKIKLQDMKDDIADILKEIADEEPSAERAHECLPVVTTPTTQRRGTQSMRLSREKRPPPLDVTHLVSDVGDDDDDDDDEDSYGYIVTEPSDGASKKSGANVTHVSSSPDILGGSRPLSQAVLIDRATKATQDSANLLSGKRKPMFHIESEEDDVSEQSLGMATSDDGVGKKQKPQQPGSLFEHVAEVSELAEKVADQVESEMKEKERAGEESEPATGSLDLEDLLSSVVMPAECVDQAREAKKARRVERRFERVASQTLESDAEEGSTPEVERRREDEFQRMVSQLSSEEVDDFQREYSQLWEEGGLTPSEDWDSRDPDTPSGELDDDTAPAEERSRLTREPEQHKPPVEVPFVKPVSRASPRLRPEPQEVPATQPGTLTLTPSPSVQVSGEKTDTEPTSTKPADDDVQSYSDRKKFWEQMTTGKTQVAPVLLQEQSETQKLREGAEPTGPPVPKPRSTLSHSQERESDIDRTTPARLTPAPEGQQPPVPGSLVASATEAASVPTTDLPVAEALTRQGLTGLESKDSEAIQLVDSAMSDEAAAEEMFKKMKPQSSLITEQTVVPEEEKKASPIGVLEESTVQKITRVKGIQPARETFEIQMSQEELLSKTGMEQSIDDSQAEGISRKTVHERSVSLPTAELTAFDPSGSVRAKKRYFEAQIKKEMVVEQLMTQLEEEGSPERKSLHHVLEADVETEPDSEEPKEMQAPAISSLEEQEKAIITKEKEHLDTDAVPDSKPSKPVAVKDMAKEFEKATSVELKDKIESEKYDTTKALPTKVVAPETTVKTSAILKQSVSEEKKTVKKVKEIAKSFEKDDDLAMSVKDMIKGEDISKETAVDATSKTKAIFDQKQLQDEITPETEERKAVKDIRSVFETKIVGHDETLSEKKIFHKEVKSGVVRHDMKEADTADTQSEEGAEIKDVVLLAGLADVISSEVAEALQYKTESTKTSDSLEVHLDKSEVEESEKEQDADELKLSPLKEQIPSITVTRSGKQRTESYSQGESEDTASQSDVTPEDVGGGEHPLYQPEEHMPDTIWEVPVQQQAETVMEEEVQDIPTEKKMIIEKDYEQEEYHDDNKLKDRTKTVSISEEEARVIAQEVIDSIEAEVVLRTELIGSSAPVPHADAAETQVAECLRMLAGREELSPQDVRLVESVIARKQREEIKRISRADTTTSSMEITDEDLRSSGVETDLSPIERAEGVEDVIISEEEAVTSEDVLEKTLAEVRESLEAAQEELIEEHKKKEEVIQKKESPSEFEFKVLSFERKLGDKIEESRLEESSASADYRESPVFDKGVAVSHTTDIVTKDEDKVREETTQIEKEEICLSKGIAVQQVGTKIKATEKTDLKSKETKVEDTRKELDDDGTTSETQTSVTFSDEEDISFKSKVTETKTLTQEYEESSKLTEETHKKETTFDAKIVVITKTEKMMDSKLFEEESTAQSKSLRHEVKEKETKIEELESGVIKETVSIEQAQASETVHETKVEKVKPATKLSDDDTSTVKLLEEEVDEQTEKDVLRSTSMKIKQKIEQDIKTERTVESAKTYEVDSEMLATILTEHGMSMPSDKLEWKEITDKEGLKRTSSEESHDSIRSPVELASSSSSTTSGKRPDSETIKVIERPDGSETVVVMRHPKTETSLKVDRRSGADFDSSGESHYYSFEQTSESGRTYSRPCSSDVEGMFAGTGSSEYESALTSQELSSRSGTSSQDYHTAAGTLSSRESMRSLDSESSGHLASVEVSSEASETLVPSALELEKDMEGAVGLHILDEEETSHREGASYAPSVGTIVEDKHIVEPYDTVIPHHVIRGESPPLSQKFHPQEYDDDGRLSSFEMVSESDVLDYPGEEMISEDEMDISIQKQRERTTSTDESTDEDRPHCMKRSHEMIFQPEPRAILPESPLLDSPGDMHEEKLGSSVEDGSILSVSYSSASDAAGLRTVIELSRADSDRQDGSVASEQLSMTVSGASEQLSFEEADVITAATAQAQTTETSTTTHPTLPSMHELQLSSVTITTSSVDESGVQSVCTQVTSQSYASNQAEGERVTIPDDDTDEAFATNGPTQVEYIPEYDDYEEVPSRRLMGHRRKESTSSFVPTKLSSVSSDISADSDTVPVVDTVKPGPEITEDMAESDKYREAVPLTLKEVHSDEKKDVDEAERLEESYQTEADQGFHRDVREGRVVLDEGNEEYDAEIRDLVDSSRPQSQVSKSDSESFRPVSSGLSDDRPDSELAELLKQCSSDSGRENVEDSIERPLSPEPVDECEIKDDTPEFSSEAQASVTELEMEYTGAFSRAGEYAAHVSPIREEKDGIKCDDEMAEAEADFQLTSHILPATISEDLVAEKHELETGEQVLKEHKDQSHEPPPSPSAIPDITVTEHMTPLLDKGFRYPDLELEEEELSRSNVQTPASMSSVASSETETDQGREYIVDEGDSCITEENELESLDEKVVELSHSVDETSAAEDKTVYEIETKEDSEEPLKFQTTSPSESPTSDSFELLEKPDLTDDYVVIEEVGKEAEEHDTEGKSVHIDLQKRVVKKKKQRSAEEDEPALIPSPPAPATRMTDLKYYPEAGDDMAPFPFEDSPPTAAKKSSEAKAREESEGDHEYEKDVEAGKKWIEMQFQGDASASALAAAGMAGYGYEMDFERVPLEDIKEEEVNDFDQSSKVGSIGSYRESIGSFGSVKDSFSSTPEYDVLAGRRYFTRSGDHDDVSMSSLQEFEQLEKQIAHEIARRKNHGSQDSLNGSLKRLSSSSRSGQGDDISLSSLKEFEGLETACIEATIIETRAKEEEKALLSEIEEGHESQVSESESCETMSAAGVRERGGESVDSDDYERRMFEIDEIIRQAQSNVERFADGSDNSALEKTESVGRGDSMEEVARIPELDLDQPFYSQHGVVSAAVTRVWSDPKATSPEGSADSLDLKTVADKSQDLMTTSADSIELQAPLTPSGKDIMTDSVELPVDSGVMATSTDSLDLVTTGGASAMAMTDSIEDELGHVEIEGQGSGSGGQDQSSSSGRDGDFSSSGRDENSGEQENLLPPRAELMLGSTDSLDPSSSTATHATYQNETDSMMSSSFTSGGSNTMVSSTDTLDPALASAGAFSAVDLAAAAARSGMWFEDVDYSASKPIVTEVVESVEGDEYSHTIRRTVELPPEVRKVTFKGPDAQRALKEYVQKFAPGEEVTETQETDDDGNVHIKRVVQQRVVIASGGIDTTAPVTGDLDPFPSDPLPSSGAVVTTTTTTQPDTIAPHLTGDLAASGREQQAPHSDAQAGAPAAARASGARRRPPPVHDISIDFDEDREVDPREHDWRFHFRHHSEEEEDAVTVREGTSAGPQTTQTTARVVGEDGSVTTTTTMTTVRSETSGDDDQLRELLDRLEQEKQARR
ncbi:uncharacterized protein LOC134539287 isoform X16 [Bacillus rossius redtenbacheri]|uniref:uncharacterized protein LOC134539287 isoform X16 n=1 Tax=Bacillus rossius redtenbacheri TaxID=93214 RepID=UPI002FDEE30C